jgi:methylthioribose-1-phosphate isomerase
MENTIQSNKRTIRFQENNLRVLDVIDQRFLPHNLQYFSLKTYQDAIIAIKEMIVRGAPLIGVTASYGMYLACLEAPSNRTFFDNFIIKVAQELKESRPTAVNLMWAVDKQLEAINHATTPEAATKISLELANNMLEADIETCYQIGQNGLTLLEDIFSKNGGKTINILTHCNAGYLGCIEWGTATSPIYQAHLKGIPVHVWVDETRPRNQGFNLTAWELTQMGVPHTLIVDNTGGHLMQHDMVDICFVGTDRTTRTGDVANKIGTYLKALAANDNNVPFYACVPSSSIDWTLSNGLEIPIEMRSEDEVKYITGYSKEGHFTSVLLTPISSPAANYGFDVTPARLVTGLITEKGICTATEEGLTTLFDKAKISEVV